MRAGNYLQIPTGCGGCASSDESRGQDILVKLC